MEQTKMVQVSREEERIMAMTEWEAKKELMEVRKALKWCIAAIFVAIAFLIATFVMADNTSANVAQLIGAQKAYASELTTAQVAPESATMVAQSVKAAKTKNTTGNPYKDVISGKTVDKTGYAAIKYVKAHKGFNGVITGKRFYPGKTFSQAKVTKILRNLYGSKVTLSKSKTAATGKYVCTQLTKVAKNVFGVKMKWNAGSTSTKLSRPGVANYIKTFATWQNGLFTPKN